MSEGSKGMAAAEFEIKRLRELLRTDAAELDYLRYYYIEADFGPAHEDVVQLINDGYDGPIPEGYEVFIE